MTLNVDANPIAALFAPTVTGNTICINDLPQIEAQVVANASYTFFIGINFTNRIHRSFIMVTSNVIDLSFSVTVCPTHIDVRVVNNSTGCEDDTRINGGT